MPDLHEHPLLGTRGWPRLGTGEQLAADGARSSKARAAAVGALRSSTRLSPCREQEEVDVHSQQPVAGVVAADNRIVAVTRATPASRSSAGRHLLPPHYRRSPPASGGSRSHRPDPPSLRRLSGTRAVLVRRRGPANAWEKVRSTQAAAGARASWLKGVQHGIFERNARALCGL